MSGLLKRLADTVLPLPIALGLRVWGGIRQAFRWVTASVTHMLAAALAAAICGNLWQWHSRAAIEGEAARWQQALGDEQRAYATLSASIGRQNEAVEALARASDAARAAGQALLAEAIKRGDAREHWAQQQRDEAAHQPDTPDCRTPAAVMAQAREGTL